MQVHFLITPVTAVVGVTAASFISGPALIGYDIHEAYQGHRPASRIAKLAADFFVLGGFVTTVMGYHNKNDLLLKKGLISWGSSLATRFALSIFSKIRGEHTNL